VSAFNFQEPPPAIVVVKNVGTQVTSSSDFFPHVDACTQTKDGSAPHCLAEGLGRPPVPDGSSGTSSIAPQVTSRAAMLVSLYSAMKQWQLSTSSSDIKCCMQHMVIRVAQKLLKQERLLPCRLLRRHFRPLHDLERVEPSEVLLSASGSPEKKERPTVPRPPDGQQRQRKSIQPKRLFLNSSKRLLPQFKETPLTTTATVLAGAMEHINSRGEGCCPWHVSLTSCCSLVHDLLASSECMAFRPLDGWQCRFCWAMNDDVDEDDAGWDLNDEALECTVCGMSKDKQVIYGQGAGSSSTATSARLGDAEATSSRSGAAT